MLVLLSLVLVAPLRAADIPSNWKLVTRTPSSIKFSNGEKTLTVIHDVDGKKQIAKTRAYAEQIMSLLKGSDLRPIPKIRGWEFVFSSNRGCASVVSDGGEWYRIVILCGEADSEDVKQLVDISEKELK